MIVERHCRGLICAACLVCFLLLPSELLYADSVPGKSQPDRLGFGSVRIHATVEGSILVFTDFAESAKLSCDVQPPPFVKITSVHRGITTKRGVAKSTFNVYVAVVTDQIGEYAGTITVKVGSQKTTVPVKVNVLAPDASATRLLIVSTPFSCSSTGDATIFDPWLRLVESAKLAPDYLDVRNPVLRQLDLSKYDVILLGQDGLLRLHDSDIAKLKQFVNEGGRLLVCANHFFVGTVEMANRLLVSAGLQMRDTEYVVTKEKATFALSGNDIIKDPFTKDVRTVKCYRPSPIAVTDKSKGRTLINAPPYPGMGFLAAGRHGRGQVIALGQSLWWNWIGDAKCKGFDNSQLLLNLVTKTAE